jgi:protein gp37
MSDNTKISWTDASWNPVAGCTPVSPGCLNCYAAKMAHRLEAMGQAKYRGLTIGSPDSGFNGTVRCDEEALTIPLRWRKPRRIFAPSMGDLFHKAVPFEFIDRVFSAMAPCPHHTFQVLTKRPERMAEYFGNANTPTPYKKFPNCWLGTSVEDQARADERIPWLLKCPAAVRFLSLEPLLGPVDLDKALGCGDSTHRGQGNAKCDGIDWVIVGGESGPGARPFNYDWARSIRDQCRAAGVAFFMKQGVKGCGLEEVPEDLRVREMPGEKP